MNRNLLRAFFYVVCVGLLVILAVMSDLAFRGQLDAAKYVTTVVVSLVFGVPLYGRIRRDMWLHPDEANGVVRSLTLNISQGMAALVALFSGVAMLSSLITGDSINESLTLTVVAFVCFALLQAERGRRPAAPAGAPLTIQHAHLYLAQAIIVVAGIIPALLSVSFYRLPVVTEAQAAALWGVGWLLIYRALAWGDTQSRTRTLVQVLLYTLGAAITVVGVWQGTHTLLREVIDPSYIPTDSDALFDVSLLTTGFVTLLFYAAVLAREAPRTPLGRRGMGLTVLAVATAVTGVPFYIALTVLLTALVKHVFVPSDHSFAADDLANSLGLLIAGALHVPLAVLLRRYATTGQSVSGQRQTYLLGGLAAGLLAFVVTVGLALYTVVQIVFEHVPGGLLGRLGYAIERFWYYLTHSSGGGGGGGCARNCAPLDPSVLVPILVTGLLALTFYWRARGEHAWIDIGEPKKQDSDVGRAAPQAEAIGQVLDNLLTEHISRDEALMQLETLALGQEKLRFSRMRRLLASARAGIEELRE